MEETKNVIVIDDKISIDVYTHLIGSSFETSGVHYRNCIDNLKNAIAEKSPVAIIINSGYFITETLKEISEIAQNNNIKLISVTSDVTVRLPEQLFHATTWKPTKREWLLEAIKN